jgi:hypothetical protein
MLSPPPPQEDSGEIIVIRFYLMAILDRTWPHPSVILPCHGTALSYMSYFFRTSWLQVNIVSKHYLDAVYVYYKKFSMINWNTLTHDQVQLFSSFACWIKRFTVLGEGLRFEFQYKWRENGKKNVEFIRKYILIYRTSCTSTWKYTFECRSGHELYWFRFFVAFLSLSKLMLAIILNYTTTASIHILSRMLFTSNQPFHAV